MIEAVIVLVLLVLAAAGGAIVRNGVPLLDAPGLGKRLAIYLTRNAAGTAPDHRLPELRTRACPEAPDALFARVREVVSACGWDVVEADPGAHTLHAVVVTPWLRFKDDLRVTLERTDAATSLHVTSRARVGRADFGANISHIMRLHEALGDRFQGRPGVAPSLSAAEAVRQERDSR